MEHKPRSLTITESADHRPRIILNGNWLRNWGFSKGDKVSVTKTGPGEILIKFTAPGTIWSAIRQKYRHRYEEAPTPKISRHRLRIMQKQVEAATEAHRRFVWGRLPGLTRRIKSTRQRKSAITPDL
jgi:hypothetical protein